MGDALKFAGTGGIESAVNALKPKEPAFPKEGAELDEEAELAKKRERDRLRRGAGANQTRKSGSIVEALSGSIGKTTLGGVT